MKTFIDYLRAVVLEKSDFRSERSEIRTLQEEVLALSRMCDDMAKELNKREEEKEKK